MNKFQIAFVVILTMVLFSCSHVSKQFTYTIKGKVIGKETGKLCILESPRSGDQIVVNIKNGAFEYTAKTSDIHLASIAFNDEVKRGCYQSFEFIAEPGKIGIVINAIS